MLTLWPWGEGSRLLHSGWPPPNMTFPKWRRCRHNQPSRLLWQAKQHGWGVGVGVAPISAGGRRFYFILFFLKRSLSSLGEMSCRAESSVNTEMVNALPAWLLRVDSNPNFSLPLPCLKQHKLGGGGYIDCSININKDSCLGKLYTVFS